MYVSCLSTSNRSSYGVVHRLLGTKVTTDSITNNFIQFNSLILSQQIKTHRRQCISFVSGIRKLEPSAYVSSFFFSTKNGRRSHITYQYFTLVKLYLDLTTRRGQLPNADGWLSKTSQQKVPYYFSRSVNL